jgi:aldose 1-epimerase
MLKIGRGDDICIIHPDIGGSIGRWSVAGQEMLRAAGNKPRVESDPLSMATFPLVPYSNRIANGRFEWDGQTIKLAKNYAPEPCAIHGVGWKRVWSVVEQSATSVVLSLSHDSDEHWPWPFEATQRISIGSRQLTITLNARNTSAHAVPLAFGHHPYFDAAGATLMFAADRVWLADENGLPTRPVSSDFRFDFHNGAPVEGREIDHCYTGISGVARIMWAGQPMALEISSTPQLEAAVVYIPRDGSAFCFEPVPHINNALNMPGHAPAMPIVAPGAAFETAITFHAVPDDR